MARKRAALFDPPTEQDAASVPEQVIRGPKGFMWKCSHCGRPASALTLAGKKVCHAHGGSTPAQRDPVAQAQAKERGEPAPRPPGRPMTNGTYSRSPGVRIDELVSEYQARQLNPDSTDEDMLYLRAYLEEMKDLRPEVEQLRAPVQKLAELLSTLLTQDVPQEGEVTVEALLDMLEKGREFTALTRATLDLFSKVEKFSKDLEGRHARLVNLSKIRSETRLKDAAAQQLDVFTLMSRRFMAILNEQLDAPTYAALQKRIERDLAELPARALVAGAIDA